MTIVCLVFAFCITWVEVWFLDSKVLPEEEAQADSSFLNQISLYFDMGVAPVGYEKLSLIKCCWKTWNLTT